MPIKEEPDDTRSKDYFSQNSEDKMKGLYPQHNKNKDSIGNQEELGPVNEKPLEDEETNQMDSKTLKSDSKSKLVTIKYSIPKEEQNNKLKTDKKNTDSSVKN